VFTTIVQFRDEFQESGASCRNPPKLWITLSKTLLQHSDIRGIAWVQTNCLKISQFILTHWNTTNFQFLSCYNPVTLCEFARNFAIFFLPRYGVQNLRRRPADSGGLTGFGVVGRKCKRWSWPAQLMEVRYRASPSCTATATAPSLEAIAVSGVSSC